MTFHQSLLFIIFACLSEREKVEKTGGGTRQAGGNNAARIRSVGRALGAPMDRGLKLDCSLLRRVDG